MLIWEGRSKHTQQGARGVIQACLTGYAPGALSQNRKTGPMVQLWILPRDVAPSDSVKTGADASGCALCSRRPSLAAASGLAPCYEVLVHGPNSVWKSHRGHVADLQRARDAQPIMRAFGLRFGAWGDPAMLPDSVNRFLLDLSGGRHTGYTHDWKYKRSQWLRAHLMASVDTREEMNHAHALGWRTFRPRPVGDTVGATERQCPAAKGIEAMQCWQCLACDGARADKTGHDRRNISTEEH